MPSRQLLATLAAVGGLAACASPPPPPSIPQSFVLIEATIPQMREAMEQGRLTSHELVEMYLARLGMYQQTLKAAIYVNANALKEAAERDRERAAGRVRGPLHGIPIALKDNIQTTNMPTSGGALAFDGFMPPYEATLTTHLTRAGAIIIAKAGLSELAGYVAGAPTPAPGDYNAVGGQGYNPYDPRRDPRPNTADGRPALNTGGSSSGIGTAANLWAASIGTETSGSILGPSNQTMLAAIKPTVGRVSRWGVIPITADQDTAGPTARTVTDAAILLGALEGTAPDPNDAATSRCTPPPGNDYTPFLKADALRGARIGIPRAFYYDRVTPPGGKEPRGGLNPAQTKAMNEAIEILKQQGAEMVDPANIPSVVETDPSKTIIDWNFCGAATDVRGKDTRCTIVVKYGMKRDFNKWLATLGPTAPVKSLTELRQWNVAHRKEGAIKYGQSRLDISDEVDLEKDRPRYEADKARDLLVSTTNGIDAVLEKWKLDAILFPGSSGSGIAARPGYPSVIVPFALLPNEPTPPFPAGFNAKPGPYGLSFSGDACSEPKLLALAFAFEQATKRRMLPDRRVEPKRASPESVTRRLMHRTLWTLTIMVAAGIATGVASQPPPDFSGQWTVEPASAKPAGPGAAAAQGDLGSGWGTTIAITQDAQQLVVEPMVYSRYDLQPQPRLVYALDGSETRNTLMLGRGLQVLASRARWEGASLTITTVHTFADPGSGKPLTIEVTQTLSLESPSTIVVEARRSGVLGGSPSTTRTVYTKG